MPPIPKFAKALAKLAKANPKLISEEPLPKIKKRNTSEKDTQKQIKTKKFAKDDMGLDKIRREKVKNKLEQRFSTQAKDDSEVLKTNKNIAEVLKEIRSQQIINYNPELISTAEKLAKIDLINLKDNQVYDCVEDLKKFFNIAKNELQNSSFKIPLETIIHILSKVPKNVNLKTALVDKVTMKQLSNAQKQLRKEAKQVGDV